MQGTPEKRSWEIENAELQYGSSERSLVNVMEKTPPRYMRPASPALMTLFIL
jgi:hypothetical protein